MSAIAPHISAFLHDYLSTQRAASQHTRDAYATAFRLLLLFASDRQRVRPSQLPLESLDATMVLDFLDHVETYRGNSAASRNARLAAVKSFFRFLEFREPALIEQCRRVIAIPMKRTDSPLVGHLNMGEAQAILDAPDPNTRSGIRDRAMLSVCLACGLRVSELIGLRLVDLTLHPVPALRVKGKGRRERHLPLWKLTTELIRTWLGVRGEPPGVTELFLNSGNRPLSRSGFAHILSKHTQAASSKCPSLAVKHVSPHVLRHTCAVSLLQATGDVRKVSLWLGHADLQSTEVYLRVDPTEKLEALKAVLPPELRPGRFRPPDQLMALLRKQ